MLTRIRRPRFRFTSLLTGIATIALERAATTATGHIRTAAGVASMASLASKSAAPAPASNGLKLLTQREAIDLDVKLMNQPGFSIDQLMELAGKA